VSVQTSCSSGGPNGTINASAKLLTPAGWTVMFDPDPASANPVIQAGTGPANNHDALNFYGGGDIFFVKSADVASVQLHGPGGGAMSLQLGGYIETESTCRFYGIVLDG
jgi:hypothetical protein